ncbi:hypothetical protein FACS1894103_4730 [Campylobacterota bacterium]|nr:hypothetical protein FACS1894103_4730 [Campylobacterota bacterium]
MGTTIVTANRQEAHRYIDIISEKKLSVVISLLGVLAEDDSEPLIIETDLTMDEKESVRRSKKRRITRPDDFVSLKDAKAQIYAKQSA